MFDTVKGSDYIGDKKLLNTCAVKAKAVFELEHMGLPFLAQKKAESIKDLLVDNQKIMERRAGYKDLRCSR